jgi:molybdate/tungstate transport system substrate-binding protein
MKKILVFTFIVFLSSSLFAKEKIIIFHAGSLSVPFAQIEKVFESKYPEYDIQREAAGSRACARKITDIKKPADIMASADYKVIDNLMIPNDAKFNIRFATNEMAIAFTDKSKYSNEINEKNWTDIFLRKDVKIGHSNPNLDPCGYRSILVTKLAEIYYKKKGFYDKLLGYGDYYENGEENKDKLIVRPKETDLLGLIEAGVYDYLFIYKSVAEQHKLKYITLSKEVSLKSSDLAKYYSQVSFKINGKKPGTFITKKGAPMVYGITIPQNEYCPVNKKGDVLFIKFLLSQQGQQIMKENGQGIINPPVITGDDSILK